MSGSSGKSNEFESRNSSKTEAGRKNLVADNSGQNYTVPKKNERKKLSSSVRIESENLSNYRDRKAKGEGSGTCDYGKNLETIRNKLKLLDITQRSSSICSKDAQAQCSLSSFTYASPRTVGLHISGPSSTKKKFPNTEIKADAEISLSNSLSSSNSSRKNDELVKHEPVSEDSSSRSEKIINICSPRKKFYFTSSSISNTSSNSGCYAPLCRHRVVNEKLKQLSHHKTTKVTSSDSTSDSPRKGQVNEPPKCKTKTGKTFKLRDLSIVEVLNKVCIPKWEFPDDQPEEKVISDRVSILTSSSDEDEMKLSDSEPQKVLLPLKTNLQSPKSNSRKPNVQIESSIQKCKSKITNKKLESRPTTRRSEQDSPRKGTSKSLTMKPTKSEIPSQTPKTSQSAFSKNENLKIKKLEFPTNVTKHTKSKITSDCTTKITTRKSNSTSNYNNKMEAESDVAVKSAFTQKVKKSACDRIYNQSKHIIPKSLKKTEDLTLTAIICSPKEESPSVQTKSGTSLPRLTHTSPIITKRKSEKVVPYKFPFPCTTIPRAFTLEGLACDVMNNTPNTKNKSPTLYYSPKSNFSDLRVNSFHLDLPTVYNSQSDKVKKSNYLIPHLKKKSGRFNYARSRIGGSSTNRRSLKKTKSLQLTNSFKKLARMQTSKSLPNKYRKLSSRNTVETMFLNLAFSDTSHSETYSSDTLSCPIPSKRICIREDSDYDIFEFVIEERGDNSSIASTCPSPLKKMCVRDKTPEMSEVVKTHSTKEYSDHSGTPSEKGSGESVPSDDFKNSILSMLLEWRERETMNFEQTNKNENVIHWVNQTNKQNIMPLSELKESEKYKTEPFAEPDPQEDVDLSVDFDEERFDQQLAVISEETRVLSEEEVNLKSCNSSGRLSMDEELMLKLPLEPEEAVMELVQTSSSIRYSDGRGNLLCEKQDATTSVQSLKLLTENKETSATCNDSFLKDVEQQCEVSKTELCDVGVTTSSETFGTPSKPETQDKSSWACGCFLMPLLKRSVFEAYQVPYGEGDPIISFLELKEGTEIGKNQGNITQEEESIKLDDQGNGDTAKSNLEVEDHSDEDDTSINLLNPSLTVGLDMPKRFLRLYDFPAVTKITTIVGDCESCMSLREKDDYTVTEPTVSILSSPRSRSRSSSRNPKDVSWDDNVIPEKKIPKLPESLDQNFFTVLYRSRSCALHSPDKSTSSLCRCRSERGFSEMSESEDEDEKLCGCFSCFRRLFGGRRKKFFDSHS